MVEGQDAGHLALDRRQVRPERRFAGGARGTGYCGTGRCGAGYCGAGYCGAGYCGTGYCGTGYCGTGYCGTGYCGTGYCGTGYCGTGYCGTGVRNGADGTAHEAAVVLTDLDADRLLVAVQAEREPHHAIPGAVGALSESEQGRLG
jgi:hypothetical protein